MQALRNNVIPVTLAIAMLAIGFVSSRPSPWAWGFNHLLFVPKLIRAVLWFLVAVMMILAVREQYSDRITRYLESIFEDGRRKTRLHLGLSLGFVLLCMFLRSATTLWGDGEVMATIAESAARQESWKETIRFAAQNDRHGPGASIVHAVIARAASGAGITAHAAIQHLHAVLGGVYLFLTLNLINELKAPPISRLWLATLLYTSGAIVLFFGYIEHYTLLYLLATVMALASHRHLDGKSSLMLVGCTTSACIALHYYLGAMLLPTLAFLLLIRVKKNYVTPRRVALAIVVITVVAAIGSRFVPGISSHFRPLMGGWEARALLSSHYVADLVSLLALLCPLLLLLLVASYGRGIKGGWGLGFDTRHGQLSSVSLLPFLIYLVFLKPDLGLARDWDLYVLLTPFMALFFKSLPSGNESVARKWLVPAILLGMLQTGAWIGINADAAVSEERYRETLVRDESHGGYAHEVLAKYCEKRGRDKEALDLYKRALAADGNPRYSFNAGLLAEKLGRTDEAIELMRRCLSTSPSNTRARTSLASYLGEKGDFMSVIKETRECLEFDSSNTDCNVFLAMALFETKQYQKAYLQLRHCLTLDLPEDMRNGVLQALSIIERSTRSR